MILTEEQAKTKWCAFIRFNSESVNAFAFSNRGEVVKGASEPAEMSRCIASGCMAWREQEQTPPVGVHVSAETVPDWEAEGYTKGAPSGDGRWWMEPPKQTLERRGFCGLAGKP